MSSEGVGAGGGGGEGKDDGVGVGVGVGGCSRTCTGCSSCESKGTEVLAPPSPIATPSSSAAGAGTDRRPLSRTPKTKSSTTSTLLIRSTLTVPDLDQLTMGVATVLHCQLRQAAGAGASCPKEFRRAYKMFHQDSYLPDDAPREKHRPTELAEIFKYVKQIFDLAQFTPECAVLALVYINRLIAFTHIPLTPKTWRLIVLSALLLAQKVWDDRCLANVDFPVIWSMVMPPAISAGSKFDLKAINRIERKFLELLQYNVTVSTSLYAKYYFELRSLAEENKMEVTMMPLTAEQGRVLEAHTRDKGARLAEGEPVLVSRTLEDVTTKRVASRAVLS